MSESAMRKAWSAYAGDQSELVTIDFAGAQLRVAKPTVEAWKALHEVLGHHDYFVRTDQTSSFNDRNIAETSTLSLHAMGIAVDINSKTNGVTRTPDGRSIIFSNKATQIERVHDVLYKQADTDMTPGMIADIAAIRTNGGKGVFNWGGSWPKKKDPMHFAIDASPSELAKGIDWSTVAGAGADPLIERHDEHSDRHAPGGGVTKTGKVARFQPLLDLIAKGETGNTPNNGYNTSLLRGRFTGGEKNLCAMTLDRIDRLQSIMLANPANKFNSSALGRYQIVRRTLLGLRRQFGLDGSALFDERMQDRLAVALIERRGRNAAGLCLEWTSLKKCGPASILAAYDKRGDGKMPGRNNDENDPGPDSDPGSDDIPTNDYPASPILYKLGSPKSDGIKVIQRLLASKNYNVGKIDGIFGSLTVGAVSAFQIDNNVPTDSPGAVDQETLDLLNGTISRPISVDRRQATAAGLRKLGSTIITNADRTRIIGWVLGFFGIGGLGSSAISNLGASSAPAAKTLAVPGKEALARAIEAGLGDLPEFLSKLTGAQAQTNAVNAIKLHATEVVAAAAKTAAPVGKALSDASLTDLVSQLLPIVANSILPGAGGSLLAIGLGLATHYFGTNIRDRRVQDHRDAINLRAFEEN